ncbi:MAG: hypothetical protein R3175_03125 [Marinobacter sp.]|uniref:hypothetical protein n=1 Tax=Marinobacter sp. TaxID=50741 RepID=UPI00299D1E23|nr:hypothetical protein [Marinobacter sp.]MDX1755031.1 hypothetical protein [Marinobacter sp.]
MTTVEIVSLIAALAALALLVATGFRVHQNALKYRTLASAQARQANRIQKKRLDLIELKNRKKLMEETVHDGTTAVEAVHRTLTGLTFDLVDRYSSNEEFKARARKARSAHDETTKTFYKALRTTNRALHVFTDMVITDDHASSRKVDGHDKDSGKR